MKRFLCILLAAALLLGCCGALAEDGFRYEGDGFDTPEEAALWYLAGLKNGDYDQMLSAFAWETQADHYDFKKQITRTKGITPVTVPGMPASNGLLRTAALEQIRDYQIHMICVSLENYINDEMYASLTSSLLFNTDEEPDEYFRRCDNGRIEKLAEMTNIRIYSPDDVTGGKFTLGKNPENYLKQNARYGADETRDVVIAADIGDETVVIAPTVGRYGSRWYVVSTGSMTSNILGVSMNTVSFLVLPDELKLYLQDAAPVASVSALPEPDGRKIRYETEGFPSPQGAVTWYLNGLKNGDVQQMMRAFAWETQAERYSLKEYALYMRAISISSPVRMPGVNAFMTDMNMGALRYQQLRKIYNAIRCYILNDEEGARDLLGGYMLNLPDEESADGFIRMFDNGRAEKLAKMDNIRLIDPALLVPGYNDERIQQRLETNRRIYGADEIMETLVAAELDGETLFCNPVLARYGDSWYMVAAGGITFAYLNVEVNRQAFFTLEGSFGEAVSKLRHGKE